MSIKKVLTQLNLGTSVAEFDEDLEKYFVETNVFREFIKDRVDIVAGDKGTGKTAIYRFINKKQDTIPELEDVLVIPAFNPTGSPVFQKLAEGKTLTESQYSLLWKTYIIALVGNTLLDIDDTVGGGKLNQLLIGLGLRTKTVSPKGTFTRILGLLPDFLKWKSAEMQFSMTEEGMPTITPRIDFASGNDQEKNEQNDQVGAEDALEIVNEAVADSKFKVWVTFDRLDEAFHGNPEVEIAALRSLLRTYLDLADFNFIKIKMFLRRDLFRRVTTGGFVNLTHINAKKIDIIWDEEDLLALLSRRIKENEPFVEGVGGKDLPDRELFDKIFPDQVDYGLRKPKTWVWMMRRVRDGNDVKPPRNLIDLIKYAREAQLRKEDREPREIGDGVMIEPDALRRGLSQLSEGRVNDTLLAEAGVFAGDISLFRDGKAEHSLETLAEIFSVQPHEAKQRVKPLVELGFLEEVKGTYKVPTLYREGLGITQGKAFSSSGNADGDEDDA